MPKKKTTEDFKKEVYDLVGEEYSVIGEYINNHTPLEIIHNKCNYIYSVRRQRFISGDRCPKCSGKKKKTTEDFKKEVYDLVGEEYSVIGEYINNKEKLLITHNKCNNSYNVSPNRFLSGRRCPYCSGLKKKTTEDFKKEVYDLVGEEYSVIGEYENNSNKISIKHNLCNQTYNVTPHNFKDVGTRCPYCSNKDKSSNEEKELLEYIRNLYDGEIITNDRKILNGKELDILIPELNIAFEYNGLYYHSELFKEDDYHLNKTLECRENNIKLIHIFEDKWKSNNEIVKSKIRNLLLKNSNRIYARKCNIKEVSNTDKNKFLDENHIQGRDISSIRLGLYYKEELVALITFCKPRKSLGQNEKSKYDYELCRYCTKLNTSVIGGFSKLLKYFENNYNWNRIITYADMSYSIGNLYEINNFKFSHISKPNYWYFKRYDGSKKYHRYSFRKQVLKNKFKDIYSKDKTEKEIMKEANFLRIYDVGNIVYEYIRE